MEKNFIKALTEIVGEAHTLTDKESLACYGYDSTPELESKPGVVVLPGSAEEISRIMVVAHPLDEHRLLIEEKSVVRIKTAGPDSETCGDLIDHPARHFHPMNDLIEVGIFVTPAARLPYRMKKREIP